MILSPVGCVKRKKYNPATKTVDEKKRIIIDTKKHDVREASKHTHRSVLPRSTDVKDDALELAVGMPDDEDIGFFVIDDEDDKDELQILEEE